MKTSVSFSRTAAFFLLASVVSGCTTAPKKVAVATPVAKPVAAAKTSRHVYYYTAADRECLKRAMYFESKRTSKSGFMAVGTVIMNRLTSPAYPKTICDVVAQKNQFAPGVMTRQMDEATAPDLELASEEILRGERHPGVKDAMFFHTDGMKFPYRNMSYVAVAGGNAFYEKRGQDGQLQTPEPLAASDYVLSFAQNPAMAIPPAIAVPQPMPEPQVVVASLQAATLEYAALPPIAPVPMTRPRAVALNGEQAMLLRARMMMDEPLRSSM